MLNRLNGLLIATLVMLPGCAKTETGSPDNASRTTEKVRVTTPPEEGATSLSLYATQYLVHVAEASTSNDAVAILDRNGKSFGVALSRKDWCNAGMEGTTTIHAKDGSIRTFNFERLGTLEQASCDDIFKKVSERTRQNIRRTTFTETTSYAPDGLGVRGYRLVPFRTVAVDPKFISIGTVLFIPKLKGVTVRDLGSDAWVHDGYVFAADTGGEIKGNHIDFFTGRSSVNPAPSLITSSPDRGFEAIIVSDPATQKLLRETHLVRR